MVVAAEVEVDVHATQCREWGGRDETGTAWQWLWVSAFRGAPGEGTRGLEGLKLRADCAIMGSSEAPEE